MNYHYNVTGEDRKKLVKAISDILGVPAKYMRVPSCAYKIGDYEVSRTGVLSWDNPDDADPASMNQCAELIKKLEEAGFYSEEAANLQEELAEMEPEEEPEQPENLSISIPRGKFNDDQLENLRCLVSAKRELMKHAFGAKNLPLLVEAEYVSFPWFPISGPEETAAYTAFIGAFCKMAIKQTRISAKERDVENEKYAFRCFLLRLGFIGPEHKKTRKILLQNLTGSAAFKTGQKKGGE